MLVFLPKYVGETERESNSELMEQWGEERRRENARGRRKRKEERKWNGMRSRDLGQVSAKKRKDETGASISTHIPCLIKIGLFSVPASLRPPPFTLANKKFLSLPAFLFCFCLLIPCHARSVQFSSGEPTLPRIFLRPSPPSPLRRMPEYQLRPPH